MIDLNDMQKRKGAIAALQAIIKSKNKQFSVDESDVDKNNKKKNPLILPKNTEILKNKNKQQNQDETPEQRQVRVDQIKADLENPDTLTQIQQDTAAVQANRKIKAQKLAQATSGATGGLISGSNLKNDLAKMLKSQIKLNKHSSETYSKVNPSYAGTKLLVAGKKIEYGKNVPSLVVYLDQSGSWDEQDIERARIYLSGLRTLEKQKLIKVSLLYFADTVESDAKIARSQRGTMGFPKILDDIRTRKPTNVMILSDGDLRYTDFSKCSPVKIDGYVIWCWRDGERSYSVRSYLQGKLGKSEYEI